MPALIDVILIDDSFRLYLFFHQTGWFIHWLYQLMNENRNDQNDNEIIITNRQHDNSRQQ